MYHTKDPLEKDILNLFTDDRLHVNAMREYFKETACDHLHDDPKNPAHAEAAYRFFDRWYKSIRRMIWINGATYTLEHHGTPPKEAMKEATHSYTKAYWKSDHKRKEARNED